MKVLLSIKPEFAEKIFNGTKKYEFRKSIFKNKVWWNKQRRGIKTIIQNQSRTGQKESIDESNYICKS